MELSYAQGWRPEEGDTIIGTVTDVAMGRSNYGGSYPIVTVQPDEDGSEPVAIHGFHAALKARLIDLKPTIGEVLGVKFLGKRPHKTDPSLEVADYVVKVKGRTADVWGSMSNDTPPPASDIPPVNAEDFAPASPASQASDDDIPF